MRATCPELPCRDGVARSGLDRWGGPKWCMARPATLLQRGLALEALTLTWNVVGIVVLSFAALAARSVALAGFGIDSLIEIGASAIVIWELRGIDDRRQPVALRLIGGAFLALACYLGVQSTLVLAVGFHPHHSTVGIVWTGATAAIMFALAAGKADTGLKLGNHVLMTEGRVTLVDGVLATSVLLGLVLNITQGWWWADPAAGYVMGAYGVREGLDALGLKHRVRI